ncbi:hypothetical protein DDZ15_01035 [Rhodohalobacter mucosus]|uniref:Uncharacterized protein n=1 Tax=Rhodohalobacter mucosus TaxID=2079485 RepID=A0A316TWA5_9BACT|nr:hypothetical protein DDZ15_01035 [Rhodohalobacter mucosus]
MNIIAEDAKSFLVNMKITGVTKFVGMTVRDHPVVAHRFIPGKVNMMAHFVVGRNYVLDSVQLNVNFPFLGGTI